MPLWRREKTYRHISCLDIDVYVHKIPYFNSEYIKLRVSYVNRRNGVIYEGIDTVKIYREDFWKWTHVE